MKCMCLQKCMYEICIYLNEVITLFPIWWLNLLKYDTTMHHYYVQLFWLYVPYIAISESSIPDYNKRPSKHVIDEQHPQGWHLERIFFILGHSFNIQASGSQKYGYLPNIFYHYKNIIKSELKSVKSIIWLPPPTNNDTNDKVFLATIWGIFYSKNIFKVPSLRALR